MKNNRIAVAVVSGVALLSPALYGQTPAKPSPYTGVSQPPPDGTITVVDEAESAAAPAAKLESRTAAVTVPPSTVATVTPPSVPASGKAIDPKCNPDFGVLGDPSPCASPLADRGKHEPVAAADLGVVTTVQTIPGELPEGTVIHMSLDQSLSTAESQAGADFTGRVTADVVSLGKVAIPQGSEVLGKVVRVTPGHRFGSPATIRLRPDVVVLPDGSRYVLRAQVIRTSSKSRVDDEGTLKPASRLKTNVIKEGAVIGSGAVAGALIGGGPGALVGSIIGAGVMTTNILVQHPASVKVPKDSMLTLSLTEPMAISPAAQLN